MVEAKGCPVCSHSNPCDGGLALGFRAFWTRVGLLLLLFPANQTLVVGQCDSVNPNAIYFPQVACGQGNVFLETILFFSNAGSVSKQVDLVANRGDLLPEDSRRFELSPGESRTIRLTGTKLVTCNSYYFVWYNHGILGRYAMNARYRVTLTPEEHQELQALTKSGKTGAKRFLYARALLLCDAGPQGPAWPVAQVAEAMGVTSRTIEHLKQRFVEEGLEAALQRRPREKPPREVIFDGAFEARLIALACSEAPDGRRRWTVRLLAEKAVELNLAPRLSHMTVQRVLKKRT